MKYFLIVLAVIFGVLYFMYNRAQFSGPTGQVLYKTNCGFFDWITRRCQLPYTPNGGIGVS